MAPAAHLLPSILLVTLAACSGDAGDPHSVNVPNSLGPGQRIRDVANPTLPQHPASGAVVNVTGAAVLAIDTFDETHNGKSRGTLYVQDVGSQEPYSGISVFSASFVPADLRLAAGDVIDLKGSYQELGKIGTAIFPAGQLLPQLAKPVGGFRYEYAAPTAKVIDPTDLNDYAKGKQWLSMLVTIKDVTIDLLQDDGKGRVTAHITSDATLNGATIANELFELKVGAFAPGTKFASITGVVTWFFNYHIAPRNLDDLKPAQ